MSPVGPPVEWAELAVGSTDRAVQAALTDDGAVWVTSDAGARWVVALGPPEARATPSVELVAPELPEARRVDDGELDPDDYARQLAEALAEARRDQARAVEAARAEGEVGAGERRVWFDGDRLWVAREDGARWSLDGGRSWTSARSAPLPARARPTVEVAAPDDLPLDRLVDAAVERSRPPRLHPSRVARNLPSLVIEVQRYSRVERGWTELVPDDGGSARWLDLALRLEWGLGRAAQPASDWDVDLVKVDGRWLLDDGTADPLLARAVERQGAGAVSRAVDDVTRLYAARSALLARPSTGSLRERTRWAMQLQEVEARLDARTGGALSAWNQPDEEVAMWWWSMAQAAEPQTVDEVLARFASEPTVQQVQAWAVERVEASPEQVHRWLAQSRSAAWLPELSVDWRMRNDWDQGYGYLGQGGVDPVPGIDLSAVPEDSGQSWTRELDLGFRWQLDELVTSSNRIRMIGEAQDLAGLRDEVTTEVTRLYFERRRIQVEDLLAPPIDLGAEARDRLRLEELTASIDAATGGAFSRGLAPRRPPG